MPLRGSAIRPSIGLHVVLGNAVAVRIHDSQVKLRNRVSLLGGLAVLAHRAIHGDEAELAEVEEVLTPDPEPMPEPTVQPQQRQPRNPERKRRRRKRTNVVDFPRG